MGKDGTDPVCVVVVVVDSSTTSTSTTAATTVTAAPARGGVAMEPVPHTTEGPATVEMAH